MPLPPAQHTAIQTLLTTLVEWRSGGANKRYFADIFRDLPDRKDYADYYVFIKEPRALDGIMASLQKGSYSTPQGVAYDLFLVWSNARTYNEPGSQVYNDAQKLEKRMLELWDDRVPPLPASASLPRPSQLPSPSKHAAPVDDKPAAKRLKISLKNDTPSASPAPSTSVPPVKLPAGRLSTKERVAASMNLFRGSAAPTTPAASTPPLQAPASAPAPAAADEASSLPPAPSTSSKITLKRPARGERSSEGAAASTSQEPAGAASSTPAADADGDIKMEEQGASLAPESAGMDRKPSSTSLKGKASESASNQKPIDIGVQDTSSGWLDVDLGPRAQQIQADIVKSLMDFTDNKRRTLADPYRNLPDRKTRADYYQNVPDPIALKTIQDKVAKGAYGRDTKAFDQDLNRLFEIAKIFIKPETGGRAWPDLMVVQRAYQELTMRHRWVPDVIPPAEQPKPDEVPERRTLSTLNYKGKTYRVGDFVHLINTEKPGKPIVGHIFKMYERVEDGVRQRRVTCCWYLRPEETVHEATRNFYPSEVLKSTTFVDHRIEDVLDRCCVMFFREFVRFRYAPPHYTEDMALYICEKRYKDSPPGSTPIKDWASTLPDEVKRGMNVPIKVPVPNAPLSIAKTQPSPFANGPAPPDPDKGLYKFIHEDNYKVPIPPVVDAPAPPPPAPVVAPPASTPGTGLVPSAPPPVQVQPKKSVGLVPSRPPQPPRPSAHSQFATASSTPQHQAPPPPQQQQLHQQQQHQQQQGYGIAPQASSIPTSGYLSGSPFPGATGSPFPSLTAGYGMGPGGRSPLGGIGSLSAYGQQGSPAPYGGVGAAPTQPAAPVAGLTPAEIAVSYEKFDALPSSLQAKFRRDTNGELLWFSAPVMAARPGAKSEPSAKHSEKYLSWKATKGVNGTVV